MLITHLGIIPDGNRRWAKENGTTLEDAYLLFADKIVEHILTCDNAHLPALSVYVASKENTARDEKELLPVLPALLHLLEKTEQVSLLRNIKVVFSGTENIVYPEIVKKIQHVSEKSKNNTGMTLFLLIGYNPFDEIALSVSTYGDCLPEHLTVNRAVDLILRTGGAPVRLSNFLPLQSGYAHMEIFDKLFPDLTEEDILSALGKHSALTSKHGK